MKWFRLVLPAAALFGLMAGSPPATAATGTASCLGAWNVDFVPGVSMTPQSAHYSTQDATIECLGTVQGSPVTGPGTLSQTGSAYGTVLGGSGSGTITVTIPTSSGSKTITFSDTLTYGPGIGFKSSNALVGPFTFVFVPTKGDGILTPVTQIAVAGEFTLQS